MIKWELETILFLVNLSYQNKPSLNNEGEIPFNNTTPIF